MSIPDKLPVSARFVLSDGRMVFVRSGIGPRAYKAFASKPVPGKPGEYKTPHAVRSLPWRESEAEAAADLHAAIRSGKGIFRGAQYLRQWI